MKQLKNALWLQLVALGLLMSVLAPLMTYWG